MTLLSRESVICTMYEQASKLPFSLSHWKIPNECTFLDMSPKDHYNPCYLPLISIFTKKSDLCM